jgi:hypothetical protein
MYEAVLDADHRTSINFNFNYMPSFAKYHEAVGCRSFTGSTSHSALILPRELKMASRFFLLCSLIFATSAICKAFPIRISSTSSEAQLTSFGNREEEPISCSFVGNPDLYGLGIRLGVYFQLFATLFANAFLDEAVGDALDTNFIFLFTLFVALVRATVLNGINSIEAFAMLVQIYAFLASVVNVSGEKAAMWGMVSKDQKNRHAQFEISFLDQISRRCLGLAISGYAIWFWLHGRQSLHNPESCSPQVFFLGRIRLENIGMLPYIVFALLYPIHLVSVTCFGWRKIVQALWAIYKDPQRARTSSNIRLVAYAFVFGQTTLKRVLTLIWSLSGSPGTADAKFERNVTVLFSSEASGNRVELTILKTTQKNCLSLLALFLVGRSFCFIWFRNRVVHCDG